MIDEIEPKSYPFDHTKYKGRLGTAMAAIGAFNMIRGLGKEFQNRYNDKVTYYATLGEQSDIFQDIMVWLNNETKAKKIRFVTRYDEVKRHYDGSMASSVTINGYKLKVSLEKPDLEHAKLSLIGEDSSLTDSNLVFSARSQDAIDALGEFFDEILKEKRNRAKVPKIVTRASYGWEYGAKITRELESVFLRDGQKETLVRDITNFLASESDFARIGAPWHRGYLLYGPPGNGKSSLALSVAKHFIMDIYTLNLSSIKDDTVLNDTIARVESGNILLVEDIDIFNSAKSREQGQSGPTLAGLLNALDGISTPHGLIVFMTTNYADNLDPALIRPGRVDLRMELLPPDARQVKKMFEYVYGEKLLISPKEFESTAQLSDVFKRNMDSAEAARLEIKEED